jgi:hypothetical protein
MADLRRSQETFEKSQKESRTAMEELQKAMAIAETVVPIKDTLDLDDFNRPVDSTILRVNVPAQVPRTEVERVLRPWLDEAGCDNDTKACVLGPDTAHRFTIHFKGVSGLALSRLRKSRALLRTPGGEWRQFPNLDTSAGGTTDKIYIDIDKNPCQLKRERDGKRLRQTFNEMHSDKRIHFNKTDGVFSYRGKPIDRIGRAAK